MSEKAKGVWDRRSNNFDFIRLALAVLVIFSHSYPLGGTSESLEPFIRLTHGQMTGGAVAVDLFFIMSGFLIAASAHRASSEQATADRSRGVFSFLKKRVARIFPAFLVLAAVTVVVVVPIASATLLPASGLARIGSVLLQTLRLREFDYASAFAGNPYPGSINGSVWSIQFEFWCYIGVALLLVAGLLRRRWLVLGLFAASLAVSVLFVTRGWVFGGKFLGVLLGSPQLWARLLPLYLAGVVFYLFRQSIRQSIWFAVAAAAALCTASFVSVGYTAVFPIAGAYLVFYLAFAPWLRMQRFGRFGDFSYGTYLYAFPIQQIVMKEFGRPVAPSVLFLCAAPLTLVVAVASWYGVERHFLRPARRKETLVHGLETQTHSA